MQTKRRSFTEAKANRLLTWVLALFLVIGTLTQPRLSYAEGQGTIPPVPYVVLMTDFNNDGYINLEEKGTKDTASVQINLRDEDKDKYQAGDTINLDINNDGEPDRVFELTADAISFGRVTYSDIPLPEDGKALTVIAWTTNSQQVSSEKSSDTALLDLTAPLITVNAPVGPDTTPTITGTTDHTAVIVFIAVTDSAAAVQNLRATVKADGSYSVDVPKALAEGVYTANAIALDSASNESTASDTGEVTKPIPLQITPIGDVTVIENQAIEPIQVSVNEPSAAIHVENLPEGLSYDASAGKIQGTPITPGTYSVTVTAAGASQNTATETFVITVQQSDSSIYTPVAAAEMVEEGGSYDLTDNISNLSELPEHTAVTDVTPEGTIDTAVPGDYTGTVKVTYPDGSSEIVTVPVHVNAHDTDGDGIPDKDDTDDDNDGVNDSDEIAAGTDPLNPDTDGNGISDGDEDADGDGLTNAQESDKNSDRITDTDNNGISDLIEKTDFAVLSIRKILFDADGNSIPETDNFKVKVIGPAYPDGLVLSIHTGGATEVPINMAGTYRAELIEGDGYKVTISDPVNLNNEQRAGTIEVTGRQETVIVDDTQPTAETQPPHPSESNPSESNPSEINPSESKPSENNPSVNNPTESGNERSGSSNKDIAKTGSSNLPYILCLGLALMGFGLMAVRRRFAVKGSTK